jgi:hypothetical protein
MAAGLRHDDERTGVTDDVAASVHWLTTATPPRHGLPRRWRLWIVLGVGFVLLWFAAALVALL